MNGDIKAGTDEPQGPSNCHERSKPTCRDTHRIDPRRIACHAGSGFLRHSFPASRMPSAEADLVFIGIVTSVLNGGRTAQVEIEQVWKGEEQPFNATVHGGPIEENLITSVDRTFEPGIYIFFPVNSSPPFEDNACTLTQPFNPSLDVINPFGVEPVDDLIDDGGGVEITKRNQSLHPEHSKSHLISSQMIDPARCRGDSLRRSRRASVVALAAVVVVRLWRNRRGHPG